MDPEVSVIITGHDRRQYLRAAIESVLAQDVNRRLYEIIVVKNFMDEEIDTLLQQEGATRILCLEKPVSRKVATGIRASRGKIISVLDDDDLFEPGRLQRVISAFDFHPTLGFYHNQFSYVGPDGAPIRSILPVRQFSRSNQRHVYLESGEPLDPLAFTYADFNTSSEAIRRDLALLSLPYLERIDGGVDTFFLFLALVSSCSLLIDDAILTRYRIHGGNVSLPQGPDEETRRAWLLVAAERQDRVNRVVREMVLASGKPAVLQEIDARIQVTQFSLLFRDLRRRRRDALWGLSRWLRLLGTFTARENLPSVAAAALFAIHPSLARATYDRYIGVRE